MPDWPNSLRRPPSGIIHSLSTDYTTVGQTALYVIAPGTTVSAWTLAANAAIYVLFELETDVIVHGGLWENGATVTANVDIGVYDLGLNRLVRFASPVAQSGASQVQRSNFASPLTLAPGMYWMAMQASLATGTFKHSTTAARFLTVSGVKVQNVGAAGLPNPASLSDPTVAFIPAFGLTLHANA